MYMMYHFSHRCGAGRGEIGRLVIHEHQNNERRRIAGFRLKCKRDCALVEQPLVWTASTAGPSAAALLHCCSVVFCTAPPPTQL